MPSVRLPARPIYAIEALASAAATLISIGIYFYMTDRFGWGMRENFRLAAAQGAVYVVGALLAGKLVTRVSHQRATAVLHVAMAGVAAVGVVASLRDAPRLVTASLLAYTAVAAMAWPILESMIAAGVAGQHMARRLAIYNVVWPLTGAIALAVSGLLIRATPAGMFLVPFALHVACVPLAMGIRAIRAGMEGYTSDFMNAAEPGSHDLDAHLEPEPELLRSRKLALWVSRLSLPATYAVIYGLIPMMPALPAMQRLDTETQTVVCSVWMIMRWLAFVGLAASTWWHTRPRALLAAAIVMFVAYLGITLSPSQIWGPSVTPAVDLAAMILWQALLGLCLGLIYSGSLYFGMVLSKGSTEHGGYHEALIGLGWVLGPLAGAIAQGYSPGNILAGVAAVGSVIALSVLAVAVACVIHQRRAPVPGEHLLSEPLSTPAHAEHPGPAGAN